MSAPASVCVDAGEMSVAEYARYVASQAPSLPRAQRHRVTSLLRSNTWDVAESLPATQPQTTPQKEM